jgi:glucosaminylphosphatidylinositol acyltransferase
LAVDFPIIFPRRFVKTETIGYGYMDIGASSIVVSSGLVSSFAKGKYYNYYDTGTDSYSSNDKKKHQSSSSSTSSTRPRRFVQAILTRFVQKVVPVLGMGMIRLLTHKGIEYQEHVSEYGIHWNFFFTLSWLATIPILRSCIATTTTTTPKPTWMIPVCIMIVYQVVLSNKLLGGTTYSGQYYIENSPRTCQLVDYYLCHIFAANREGILGCIPYTALYLLSEKIAFVVFVVVVIEFE